MSASTASANASATAHASMGKSVAVLAVGALLCVLFAAAAGIAAVAGSVVAGTLAVVLSVVAAALAALAAGGRIARTRQLCIDQGEPDLLVVANDERSERAVLAGRTPRAGAFRRSLARVLYGRRLLVGDAVRVRSLEEIRATLDAEGCLEGLPFMEEMKAFCGRPARVYRVVHKVYDYGRTRELRRLDRSVLLVGQRCDGNRHDGCDAACYLLWKEAWLEPFEHDLTLELAPTVDGPRARPELASGVTYDCQYTRIGKISRPVDDSRWIHQIEPWIVGNFNARAFWVTMATRAFNAFQGRRGGAGYPWRPANAGTKANVAGATAPTALGLKSGDWVRVRTPAEIAATLNAAGYNRGLWFDGEQLKGCGQSWRVLGRVERIIDIKTTQMIPMKTACIALDGLSGSGEFIELAEQRDFMYYREAWLERVAPPTA